MDADEQQQPGVEDATESDVPEKTKKPKDKSKKKKQKKKSDHESGENPSPEDTTVVPTENGTTPVPQAKTSADPELPKNATVNSGQTGNIVFVDGDGSKYKCVSCGNALRVPVLFMDCGHRCCSTCLPNMLRGSSRCPVDNEYLKQDRIKVDREFQIEMDELMIRCSHVSDGCQWTGKLAQLGSHLTQCGYKITSCPQQCGVEIPRAKLEKHLSEECPKRSKTCRFCDASLIVANELKHIAICPKFPVSCPNGCKKHEIARSQLAEHLAGECSKQDLPCPFEQHGCSFRARKKKMDGHLTETQLDHLTQLNASVQQMSLMMQTQTKTFTELKSLITQQTKRITALERCLGASFTWKVDNYSEKVNLARSGKQTTVFSPPFYTHRGGYRMALSACLYGSGDSRGKFMSLFVCLCRGEHDVLLPWPFTHQLTFILLDQHADFTQRKPIEYTIKPNPTAEQNMFLGRPTGERNACFGAPRFIKLESLKASDYIVDDNLFIKVSMNMEDLPAM